MLQSHVTSFNQLECFISVQDNYENIFMISTPICTVQVLTLTLFSMKTKLYFREWRFPTWSWNGTPFSPPCRLFVNSVPMQFTLRWSQNYTRTFYRNTNAVKLQDHAH